MKANISNEKVKVVVNLGETEIKIVSMKNY